jgi:hypothetical protein
VSEDAITSEESVALYRRLAAADPSFRSDLAMSGIQPVAGHVATGDDQVLSEL